MLPISYKKQVLLSRQLQQKTLPHAIIIQGVEGTAKEALANWLVDLLICQTPELVNNTVDGTIISQACQHCKTCKLRQSGNYPDHIAFIDDNKTLGVDDIRRGNSFLETKPHIGLVKTMCIHNAKNMTTASANALLKTLEEPNQNNYIVLVTEELDSLLPTIISRCAVYSLRSMVGEALLNELNVSDQVYNSAENIDNSFINLSQLPELTDDNTRETFESFKACVLTYLDVGDNEETLLNLLVNNSHSLRWLEKIISNLIRQYYLTENPSVNGIVVAQKISIQALNQIFQTIISSNKLIKSYTQANRQFVGEKLVMTINTIVRPMT